MAEGNLTARGWSPATIDVVFMPVSSRPIQKDSGGDRGAAPRADHIPSRAETAPAGSAVCHDAHDPGCVGRGQSLGCGSALANGHEIETVPAAMRRCRFRICLEPAADCRAPATYAEIPCAAPASPLRSTTTNGRRERCPTSERRGTWDRDAAPQLHPSPNFPALSGRDRPQTPSSGALALE
jgi:hypothetical protein